MSHTLTQQPAESNSASTLKVDWFEPLLDRGFIPDWAMGAGIRQQLCERVRVEDAGTLESKHERLRVFLAELR